MFFLYLDGLQLIHSAPKSSPFLDSYCLKKQEGWATRRPGDVHGEQAYL